MQTYAIAIRAISLAKQSLGIDGHRTPDKARTNELGTTPVVLEKRGLLCQKPRVSRANLQRSGYRRLEISSSEPFDHADRPNQKMKSSAVKPFIPLITD